MQPYVRKLHELIERATPMLLALPEGATTERSAPGRWSQREILGHLVDSASNNHQRFVRAQFQDSMVFAGYDQDAWVSSQRYQEAPWAETVGLWRFYNLHLARVMTVTPRSIRERRRDDHNLDRIAWKTVPADEPATLDYFMDDYVAHLEHHLGQILGRGPI